MNTGWGVDEERVLGLLDAVGERSEVSQRDMAKRLGIALGLANSYLKRCVRKGYIKISDASANRYLYYLTPKGFAEKSRLTAMYLTASLSFYRKAGESCLRVYRQCEALQWRQVVLCGVSDLAEIASLKALESGVEILGNYDPRADQKRFVNAPVWNQFNKVCACDGWIVTDLQAPTRMFEHIIELVGPERLLVPDILRLE